jgi:hypothetical protein
LPRLLAWKALAVALGAGADASGRVAAPSVGILQTMRLARLKLAVVVLLAVGLSGVAAVASGLFGEGGRAWNFWPPWQTKPQDNARVEGFKDIDPATIAAYERLGAIHIKMGTGPLDFENNNAEKGLPGFRFAWLPQSKLPEVSVPFCLVVNEWGGDDPMRVMKMKELAGLRNLTALSLPNSASLKELAGLPNLTTLRLNCYAVRDLKELAALQKLTALELNLFGLDSYGDPKFTVAAMKEVTALKDLTALHLSRGYMSDAAMKELAALKNLTTLRFDLGIRVTDAGFRELAALTNLTTLQLSGPSMMKAGLKELAGLKNLSTLRLPSVAVTDAALKELAGLKNLSTLDLTHTIARDGGVQNIPKGPHWPNVFWRMPVEVTDGRLKELAPLRNLSTLYLDKRQVTDEALRSLQEIGLLHALWLAKGRDGKRPRSADEVMVLDLNDTRVTEKGAAQLRKELPRCEIPTVTRTDGWFGP